MTDPIAPVPASPPAPGGHGLPARFSGSVHETASPRGRRHRGWLLGSLGVVAVLAVFAALQITANLGYDSARAQYESAAGAATPLQSEVAEQHAALSTASGSAAQIVQNDSGRLLDAAAKDALAGAVAEAEEVAAAAAPLLEEEIPSAGEKPDWFWELFGTSEKLDAERGEVEELTEDLEAESTRIETASTSVEDSGLAVLAAAANAATGFEAAHISARNDAVIGLRDAATDAVGTSVIDEYAVETFVALETAATQLVESEQAELAEKAGPLQGPRLEVEAFARSLAPGVLLEFDWAPIVNGFGTDGGMGGYTTWWWDEPGRSVIELSDSVAEQWPSSRSQALVAHEVGHAISVKCEGMYDASTQDSIEKWATAWAIGMGFSDDANGVWAYGYPPQSYIDAAMGCR